MERTYFETFGAGLGEDDFACAVAALIARAALHEEGAPLEAAIRERSGPHAEPIAVAAVPFSVLDDAEEFRDLWRRAVPPDGYRRSGPRFELPEGEPYLRELLSRRAVGATSVYARNLRPHAGVTIDWPLRIGILPGERAEEAKSIVAASHWSHLVEPVLLSGASTECDILLLPCGLRTAAATLLLHRDPLHADCVFITGLADAPPEEASALMGIVRTHTSAAGIAIASVAREAQADWLNRVVETLAHDQPLDAALFAAGEVPPILFASRALLDASRLSTRIEVLAERIESAGGHVVRTFEPASYTDDDYEITRNGGMRGIDPETIFYENPPYSILGESASVSTPSADLAAELRQRTRDFSGESHAATEYVSFKKSLPRALRIPRPAAQPAPEAAREVLAATYDSFGNLATGLLAGSTYQVDIRIGFPAAGDVSGGRFAEELLPAGGHELRVIFCELPQGEEEAVRQPQTQTIFLPRGAESERARFYFRTGAEAAEFEARVLILYENRVLHTNRYKAALGEESVITFDPELDVGDLALLDEYERFEGALVVNKAGGRMGVLTVADEAVRYTAPLGLEGEVLALSGLLSTIADEAKLPAVMTDPFMAGLLFKLANRGHVLWETLNLTENAPQLAKAARIHVVAARSGELLPVELLYPRPAPQKQAFCTHAATAMKDGNYKTRCTSKDPRVEVCPLEFWALNRVIEHVSFLDNPAKGAAKPLQLFRKALLGVSKNVYKKDADKVASALERLTGAKPLRVGSSQEWQDAVRDEQPSLLVLLPHSEERHPDTGMPALEIGGDLISRSWLGPEHVVTPGAAPPVVLLLGCTTTVTDLPFQNFAEAIKKNGAAVVLGTLSVVLGRHAAPFAVALLEALHAAAGKGLKFGDVLLNVKRRRIGAGDPFALSLLAYGDVSIRM